MPIDGLSDKRRFQRLGKLRLGEKRISERTQKEHPVTLDHFKCSDDDGSFHKLFGAEPRRLGIVFPYNTPDLIFPHFRENWTKGGLKCKGDGVRCEQTLEDGQRVENECAGNECAETKANHCKPVGHLRFFIPSLSLSGYYQVSTSSYNSIVNINSALELAFLRFKQLQNIPFILEVRMNEVEVEGKKKKIPVCYLMVNEESVRKLKVEQPALKSGQAGGGGILSASERTSVDSSSPAGTTQEEEEPGPPQESPKKKYPTFSEFKENISTATDLQALQKVCIEYNNALMAGTLEGIEFGELKELYQDKVKELKNVGKM